MTLFGAIEAGGTKFVCGVGNAERSLETEVIATRDFTTTLADVTAFFKAAASRHGPPVAIGIGSFGPLELDPTSPRFGRITTTPKPGWRDVDIPAWLRERFSVPVVIDTDVNAAALAEARAHGVDGLVYVTVGTGIGVGSVTDGLTRTRFGHAEAGHIPVRRHGTHGSFVGTCPFHGDCLEGLASGPAIKAAWGASLAQLPPDHPAWEAEAFYLGQLCATLILTLSPAMIVMGGGVLQQTRLLPMIRDASISALAGYCAQWDRHSAEKRIVAPISTQPPGLVGAYLLAEGHPA